MEDIELSTLTIILLIILVVLVAVVAALYFYGRRVEKQRDEQQAQIQANKQPVTMLVIDKKRLRFKESGLPDEVIAQAPWYSRRSKLPIVKAKIGPQIMNLVADESIFDQIPVKKQVKAMISGIYIVEVKGMRGALPATPEKKGFLAKLRDRAANSAKK